jgi:hypothetical protein
MPVTPSVTTAGTPPVRPANDGQSRRLRLEESHAVRLVDRRPQIEVGAGIDVRQRGVRQSAGEADPLAERRHHALDLVARRAVADQQRLPRPVAQEREGLRQHAIGGELVARAHHADAQQHRHIVGRALPRRRIAERPRVDERRQPALMGARPQPSLHAGHVARIDAQHQVGFGQRAFDRAMAEPRRTLGAARGVRGFGDDVGDVERAADDRARASRACDNSNDT